MAKVKNLRMARKRRERAAKDKAAADARIRHGVPKEQRGVSRLDEARASRLLDGAKLERDD
ncbi:DUF4169 family protein [Aurantiacibacter zhengii]|uniref:DUF4169 family protein n=1 Tax=Aurantiacibacter zhengii TaxID=2307003 RepID=A0A418NX03_9SPHN|nr:DUF4169 family protein [Aurantiacibacter zhengii]RIV89142.1 DUF4169 family protein [Aurantiacibacter zhengii]